MTDEQLIDLENHLKQSVPQEYNLPILLPKYDALHYCARFLDCYTEYSAFMDGIDDCSEEDIEAFLKRNYEKRLAITIEASRLYKYNTDFTTVFRILFLMFMNNVPLATDLATEMTMYITEYRTYHDERVFDEDKG